MNSIKVIQPTGSIKLTNREIVRPNLIESSAFKAYSGSILEKVNNYKGIPTYKNTSKDNIGFRVGYIPYNSTNAILMLSFYYKYLSWNGALNMRGYIQTENGNYFYDSQIKQPKPSNLGEWFKVDFTAELGSITGIDNIYFWQGGTNEGCSMLVTQAKLLTHEYVFAT